MATWQTTGAHLVGPTGPKGDTGDTGPAGPMWASAYTLPYASTITPNCNNGYDQRCTLTGSPTIALATNPTDTQYLLLWFQASGGNRTVTFNSSYETTQQVPGRVFTIPSGTWGSVLVRRRGTTWVLMAAYPQPINETACEYQLTTAYTGLAANTDYLMAGNMSKVADPLNMFSTAFVFYRVIIPYAGRWGVEWTWLSSATTGTVAGKVLLNVPNGTANATAVANYSIMTDASPAAVEGSTVSINQSRVFAANDTLAFSVWDSVTFNMPISRFGGIRTRLVVRYLGPD